MKQAFSLIEVIFVMIILGIVVSLSSTAILQLYQNQVLQKTLSTVNFTLQHSANQIQNRLIHAIPASLFITTNSISWVGSDYDSFSTMSQPLWSGYCDINATLKPPMLKVYSPGSQLTQLNTLIKNLSNKKRNISHAALFFHHQSKPHPIQSIQDNTTFILKSPLTKGSKVSSHYALAWSGYNIFPINVTSATHFDLALSYNYQPWHLQGDKYKQTSLLIKNVSLFKLTQTVQSLSFKLCIFKKYSDETLSACQERVIPL